jgi:hypothetical protein
MNSAWAEEEVVQFALLSPPSRNSSNKCTFHTKGLFISSPDKPRSSHSRLQTPSLCDPKVIPLQMPSSEDGPKLGSCLQCVVAAALVPLPIVKLASIYSIFKTVRGTWVLQREGKN